MRQAQLAQPGEFAGAADAVDPGIQPWRDQQSDINRGVAWGALAGFDRVTQRAEVEPGDEGIHEARLMVRRQHGIQRTWRQDHPIAHRPT
jgi:hypothetical protein